MTASFDYNGIVAALIGGLLIAFATTIHLLCKGRITGMSGIFYGIITHDKAFAWRVCLVSGMILTSGIAYHVFGFNEITHNIYAFDSPQTFNAKISTATLIIGGLLVGLGTKLGNGCTSGHGVCGIPRLSVRSFVAVVVFMTTGFIMANTVHYSFPNYSKSTAAHYNPNLSVNVAIILSLLVLVTSLFNNRKSSQGIIDTIISFITGVIFCLGLLVSGMSRKSKVSSFLTFNNDWDASLIFVMGGAVLFNLVTFNYIIHSRGKPIWGSTLQIPSSTKIDARLIIGAAIFGLGWGLVGICPGPAIIITPIYLPSMIQFMVSMAAGQYLAGATGKIIDQLSSLANEDQVLKLNSEEQKNKLKKA